MAANQFVFQNMVPRTIAWANGSMFALFTLRAVNVKAWGAELCKSPFSACKMRVTGIDTVSRPAHLEAISAPVYDSEADRERSLPKPGMPHIRSLWGAPDGATGVMRGSMMGGVCAGFSAEEAPSGQTRSPDGSDTRQPLH